MYESFGSSKLKNGLEVELGRVRVPDDVWGPQLLDFFKPLKADLSFWHIAQGVELEDPGGVINHYYIAHQGSEILGSINIAEHDGCAQYGHVHTRHDQRGQGICNRMMEVSIADYRARGGKMMILCTIRPDAHHLYDKFGFKPVDDRPFVPGVPIVMNWFADQVDEDEFYDQRFMFSDTFVREFQLKDWILLSVLTLTKQAPPLRSLCTDTKTYGRFELHTRELLYDMHVLGKPVQARVLESKGTGASVGFVILRPDPRFSDQVQMLDFFIHPHLDNSAGDLLSAIDLGKTKVQIYMDHSNELVRNLLVGHGFREEARLSRQFQYANKWYDVFILSYG